MRSFFMVLCIGLGLVFVGIALVWGTGALWNFISKPNTDGSLNQGLSRILTYTATEEEDVVDSVIQSLEMSDGPISAQSYIVKNLTTNTVWTELDSTRSLPMASLAKLVTAAVVRRSIRADKEIPITREVVDAYGNTAGFKSGERFAASDLLYPLLMVSSNDAAEAFARRFGRANFIKAMNDFVNEIGAYKTYFTDPTGLSKHDVTTANDMAIIIDWIRRNDPGIFDITLQKTKKIGRHTWVNPTHFLSWSYYEGGKNGFTDEAGRTAAGLFRLGRNRDLYAVVVLGSDNRDADVVRLIDKVR